LQKKYNGSAYYSFNKVRQAVEKYTYFGEDIHSIAIDHSHITNHIRGLLCNKCNLGLGFFRDDLNLLQNAIDYLADNS
jgi:hypothetical protein